MDETTTELVCNIDAANDPGDKAYGCQVFWSH